MARIEKRRADFFLADKNSGSVQCLFKKTQSFAISANIVAYDSGRPKKRGLPFFCKKTEKMEEYTKELEVFCCKTTFYCRNDNIS